MEVLKQLLEQREQAFQAYESFIQPLVAENRALSDEEETQRTELRAAVQRLDQRIDEVKAEEDRKANLTEARKTAGIWKVNASVTKEPRIYEYDISKRTGKPQEVHGRSFVRDLIVGSQPTHSGYLEAQQRLQQHGYEQAVEMSRGTAEGKLVRSSMHEQVRESNEARDIMRRFEERGNAGSQAGAELRAGTTSTIAGFTTPVYFVDQWLQYKVPGRPFADACTHMDLPDYGLTVYRPHFTAASAVGTQASENTAVAETDPTSAYLSASLSTLAGQVTVSIQLLERSELRNMDAVIFGDLNRQYARQVDILALTQALAGAGAQTIGTWALTGAGSFWAKTAAAKSAVETAAGQLGVPSVMFMQPNRWEYIMATGLDTQNRALIVPDDNGPVNALGSGDEQRVYQGNTGYRVQNLSVNKDINVPAPGVGTDQIIVADLTEVWLFENVPTPRVLPQTLGQNLSVILQTYGYATVLVGYPAQVQAISGAGFVAPAF